MARKKRQNKGDNVALEMTPMIDVVFQLLIFFIVTLKQDDILANLDALRPAPDDRPTPDIKTEPLTIMIGPLGLYFNGTIVSEDYLKRSLSRIAQTNPDTTVIIKCTNDSRHGQLVRVLDVCNSLGLKQLSVFSM